MLYPHFSENYLSCFKFAIFLPTNFSEEPKTISPHKTSDTVMVKRAGNFNRLLIVKISESFKFEAKMIDRKSLRKGDGKYAKATWGGTNLTKN